MTAQKWKASWTDPWGYPREYTFYSLQLRSIARIDFALKCQEQGVYCPNEYILEETNEDIPRVRYRRESHDRNTRTSL